MRRHLFVAILFLTACSESKKNAQAIVYPDGIPQSQQHIALNPPDDIKSDFFEIVDIGYHDSRAQTIFVVISPKNVNDTSIIKQIINAVKQTYPLANKSSISFFSEKKYANYKTELFTDETSLLPKTEYQKWKDNYYLGEYEFKTTEYKTFPASSKWRNQKTYHIILP
jgi:hypothetical protein